MSNRGENEPIEEAADQPHNFDRLQMEAMMAEITRRLQIHFDNRANQANEFFHDFDPYAGGVARGGRAARGRFARGARMGAKRGERLDAEEDVFDTSDDGGAGSHAGGVNHHQNRPPRAEDNLGSLKLRIPPFVGKNDPDAYLEWEKKIELVFNCQNYSEEKKVKLATTGFSGYVIHWWEQIASTRRRNGVPQITSWFEMKTVMKKRFAPGYMQDSPRQRRPQERLTTRLTVTKSTRQEPKCSREKPALQQLEANNLTPICKGKKANSNLKDVTNESFMCNYRKQIPRRLFVESAENNNEEKKEVSEILSSSNEATVAKRLFGTKEFSNDSIPVKCFLPSSQIDSMPKGKEIYRELTTFEPVSPSSYIFSPQEFEEDTLEEVPKKVPPARNRESLGDAMDVFKTRGGEEKTALMSTSPKSETSLADGELMVKRNFCEFDKDLFFVPPVSLLDEICLSFTDLKPVQPSSKEFSLQDPEESLLEKIPKKSLLDRSLAIATNLVPSQTIHSSFGESRLKLCKEIGVTSSLPSLFVLVTLDEEKQFGLENVKELRVSGIVFDKMIQSFEAPKYETFSRSKCSLFAETWDSKFVLNHKLVRRTLGQKLIEVDADLMFDECFPKLGCFSLDSNKVLHNSNSVRQGCEILCCENFWVLKPCEMNSVLKENVFGSFCKIEHDFAWSERVLPKYKTDCAMIGFWLRNIHDLVRAKRRSEFEYVETAFKLAQSNLFASNYISLFGLCLKEKFCASECSNARMIYDHMLDGDLRNLNFVFKVLNLKKLAVYFFCTFDVVFLVLIRKQDKQVMDSVLTTRMIQGLDKQVDYGPKEHLSKEWCQNRASTGHPQQSYQFGDWIWNHTRQPLQTVQGKYLLNHASNDFNLFSFVADESDLRSNPFEGGGDGVIMDGQDIEDQLSSEDEDEFKTSKEIGTNTNGEPMDEMETTRPEPELMAINIFNGPITRSRTKLKSRLAKKEPACWFNQIIVYN